MRLKNILSITEARKNLFKLIDRAQKKGNYFVLTERGKPKAVIMSADEFVAWQETLEIQRDPQLMKEIEQAEADFKKGDYVTLQEVLAQEGFSLADKPKKKYVSSRHQKKRAKKAK